MRTLEQTFQELTILISDQSRDLALAMAELASVAAERDKLKLTESFAVAGWNKAVAERDTARQSLRAAEQEVAEMEADYADLRTVNARLIAERDAARDFNDILKGVNLRLTADLAAAVERLNHAESIIMQ